MKTFSVYFYAFCFLTLAPPANVVPTQNFKKHNLGILIGKLWKEYDSLG